MRSTTSQYYKLLLTYLLVIATSSHILGQTNPLQGDIKVHDPVMIKQGDTYYVFHTGKGISIKTSTDRIHWKNAGRVFSATDMPAWFKTDIPNQDGSLWAPDVHFYKGVYYLYYSVSAWMNFNSSVGFATNTTLDAADPAYKWVDHGPVTVSYTHLTLPTKRIV